MPTIGGRFEVDQPDAGEVTRLPVVLLDDDGAVVTGVAFDDAGMDVEYAKAGGTFANFPSFDTTNWREVGRGAYEVILDGDEADEKALLDTEGDFYLYVKTTATSANFALSAYKVSPSDTARDDEWTDERALLVDNLDATVSSRGTGDGDANAGDAMALVADAVDGDSVEDFTAFMADVTALALEATLTAMKGATFATLTDSLEALRNRGDAAWTTGGSGTGVNSCPLTYTDDDSNAVAGLKVSVKNVAEDTTVATGVTNSLGVVTFNLDDESYHVLTPSTAIYELTNNTLVVSGTTAAAYEVTTNAIPAPSDATLCRCYAYMREIEGGTVLGEDEGTLDVRKLRTRPSGATIIYGDGVAARGTDANGLVYVDIVRGAVVQMRGTWTGTSARTEDIEVTVPAATTYNVGALFQT